MRKPYYPRRSIYCLRRRIEQAVPAEAMAGERYNEHAMAQLDSERG